MQRSNASSLRVVIIACVLTIILLSGLYLMKRMEANKLSNNLKIAESRLTRCEDLKAGSSVELEQAQQKVADCQANKATVDVQKATLQEGVNNLREENIKLADLVDTLEEEVKDTEKKEEQCELENSECQGSLDKAENDLFQCKQSAEQTSKRLQSLQTQLQDLQAKQAQEVVQRAVGAPKVEENPPVQAEQAGNLQDTFSEGVPGEAEEADIAKEVSELEADFKDVLGELDDQANTGDEEDDQKIDEDLGEDKELIAELEADENNVV